MRSVDEDLEAHGIRFFWGYTNLRPPQVLSVENQVKFPYLFVPVQSSTLTRRADSKDSIRFPVAVFLAPDNMLSVDSLLKSIFRSESFEDVELLARTRYIRTLS